MSESDPKPSTEKIPPTEWVKSPGLDYFDLQFSFAKKVAKKLGAPLTHVLFTHTNLFRDFGGRRGEPESHPLWQTYLNGLADHQDDPVAYTYSFFRKHRARETGLTKHYGSFSFNPPNEHDEIRIHFRNAEPLGVSPLSSDRHDARINDLRAMFTEIKKKYPYAKTVRGGSWLYNLKAYRRLFPDSYTNSRTEVDTQQFQGFHWWGQFLDKDLNVDDEMTRKLFERLEKVDDDHVADAFPFKPLRVSGPIQDFYDKYEIKNPQ